MSEAALLAPSSSGIAVQRLREELLILKEQLLAARRDAANARARTEELEAEREAWHANCRRSGSAVSVNDEEDSAHPVIGAGGRVLTNNGLLDGAPRLDAFRANGGFPIRYVPPLEFLPALFVEQYIDVIQIIDRYAQLYHRYHVGGGQRDPALVPTEQETSASTVQLLELRVTELEKAVAERDATIEYLTEQLGAWRATGRERSRYAGEGRGDTHDNVASHNRDPSGRRRQNRHQPPQHSRPAHSSEGSSPEQTDRHETEGASSHPRNRRRRGGSQQQKNGDANEFLHGPNGTAAAAPEPSRRSPSPQDHKQDSAEKRSWRPSPGFTQKPDTRPSTAHPAAANRGGVPAPDLVSLYAPTRPLFGRHGNSAAAAAVPTANKPAAALGHSGGTQHHPSASRPFADSPVFHEYPTDPAAAYRMLPQASKAYTGSSKQPMQAWSSLV